MRYLTLGLLLALTLVLASPVAAAGGPPIVPLPDVGLFELVLDWLGISEAVDTSVQEMGPAAEPGGVTDSPSKAPEPSVNMGPAIEPNG